MEVPGGSLVRPPVLDGTNYSYWKVKMRAYIKSIDERAWRSILTGWTAPKLNDADGDTVCKQEIDWTNDEIQVASFNSKALNAIFSAVDMTMFKVISNCISAKDAWDTLQLHCEGSNSVRRTKLRLLTTRFENLRMEEDESIASYNAKICDIANEAQALGDAISNERLVSKAMRSLPERFNVKIYTIEETKNTDTLSLDELMGILQTFELNLAHQVEHKKRENGKSIAFQAQPEMPQSSAEATDAAADIPGPSGTKPTAEGANEDEGDSADGVDAADDDAA